MATRGKQKKKKTKGKSVTRPVQDRRIPKVIGIMVALLSVYLWLAFLSYLTTWKADQDKVFNFEWGQFFDQTLEFDNWLNRFGAITSNAFFYWGIGISSFIVVFVLLKLAYILFTEKSLKELWSPLQYAITFVLYCSPLAAFVFESSDFPWGGSFGSYVSSWLVEFVGKLGAALLFVFVGFAFLMWNFNHIFQRNTFSFSWPKIPFSAWFSRSGVKKSTSTRKKEEPIDDGWDRPKPITDDSDSDKKDEKPEPVQPASLEFDLPQHNGAPVRKSREKPETELEINEPILPKAPPMPVEDTSHIPVAKEREKPELIVEEENVRHLEPYDPTQDLSRYERPRLSMLKDYEQDNVQIDRKELEQNKDQIIETLRNYKIEIERIRATIGPTVTLYEIVPAPGVRISKIKNLEDDIALSLAALGIRIIAPIPGKGTIGIEVPNKNKQVVGLKEVLHSDKFRHAKMDLPIALGKTIANEVFIADLAKMPHLLIAGATGQGKSVGINTILMSLLYKKHPSQVKLVLIDPKKVELFPYSKLANHFLAFLPNQDEPIITETKKVVYTLNSLCIEMDQRYDLLKKAHARNIGEYNKKFISRRLNPNNGHRFMPFIVLVIDEFADLIMTAGKEVELPIARLAQLARAVGIHLIIATQRPSVNIITGVIKANFPARLAFRVTSKVDSRTILDAGGADQLIGRGDMLLTVGGDMIRLQCAFVDTPEVEDVIDSIGDQKGFAVPFFLPEYAGDDEDAGEVGGVKFSDLDDMFEDAAMLVVQNQHGSTSMIQRRLKLGYNRAGRIMDQLEAFGIVGPNEGSKARQVLMNTESELHSHLDMLRENN